MCDIAGGMLAAGTKPPSSGVGVITALPS